MNQRIEAIDAVRGFALFGILLVNMTFFQFGMAASKQLPYTFKSFDQGADWFIQFFGSGNFISLFSFLFGVSIIMLQSSVLKKEKRFFPVYTRRIIILLILGYLHVTFIWIGDILFSYGLMGIFLAVFINRKPKTLLIWSCILLTFTMLLTYPYEPETNMVEDFAAYIEKEQHIHETGTYVDHVIFRATETPFQSMDTSGPFTMLIISLFAIITVAPIFLLGMYVAKKGWLFQIDKHISFTKKVWLTTGIFSFSIKISALLVEHPILVMLKDSVTHFTMALFYATSIILLIHAKKAPRLFKYMANMGKMSVSNYLTQSIIATTIFYAYGLGLFGDIGLFFGIVLTIVIYVIQLVVSTYWLKKFRMGPVEYVWRLGTYWKKPTFRKKSEVS
ncbi:hypothetical protein BAMA_00245 [Bacillus manliponensis]|uniref:DUF418 domain-containing protein n=1 Tax=Bacillus manliponensis TaxID=574376 RepID=A0A073KG03_9BACI|nr:DUF418 domain-containing protein [Bacillus manliponensis]KEK21238.1 hypothetical protein BAMA_00245 [Bacillus manliponensis]